MNALATLFGFLGIGSTLPPKPSRFCSPATLSTDDFAVLALVLAVLRLGFPLTDVLFSLTALALLPGDLG